MAQQAQSDLTVAYNGLAGEPFTQDMTGVDLGGKTLGPGVYHFNTSASLSGILTLDALGNPNATFHFQIGSTLITATNSAVHMINGGDPRKVFWQVGSSATLGTGTAFAGNILANVSITGTTGSTLLGGRALARSGAVTVDSGAFSNAPLDTVKPTCFISKVTATQVQITGQDTGSGLATVQVISSTNLTTVVSPFVVGTNSPVVVTGTKINSKKAADLVVQLVDVDGNVTVCDPIVTTLTAAPFGGATTQSYVKVAAQESIITLVNGAPGLSAVWISVNGHKFVTALQPRQRWIIDVGSAMLRGPRNTITVTALGTGGSTALLVIGDSVAFK